MRTILFSLAILAMIVPTASAVVPEIRLPDGITALISPAAGLADEVILRNGNGDFEFDVSIFATDGMAWSQVAQIATLRVAVYAADLGKTDAYSQGFVSDADGVVRFTVPGSVADAGQVMDVWVTFYKVTSYPTSHYSVQKNALIEAGQYDAADAFDYHHGVNPIAG